MHLKSIWRDPKIIAVDLDKLSPVTIHENYRHRTKTTPSMQQYGLFYPLACVKFTSMEWVRRVVYGTNKEHAARLYLPVVNEDKFIWAVKVGCNRWHSAKELGYTSIDCIFFQHTDDAVKMSRWYDQCDPLHTQGTDKFRPYAGLYDYI